MAGRCLLIAGHKNSLPRGVSKEAFVPVLTGTGQVRWTFPRENLGLGSLSASRDRLKGLALSEVYQRVCQGVNARNGAADPQRCKITLCREGPMSHHHLSERNQRRAFGSRRRG